VATDRRWMFQHPCRDNFISIVNEIVKREKPRQFPDGMDWYFDQVLYGTGVCDYSIASIDNFKKEEERGYFTDHENCEIQELNNDMYESKVVINRLGEIKIPVEIRLTLEDGKQSITLWDGKDRSSEIVMDSKQKIISAEIDPYNKLPLDKNILNNSLTIKKNETGVRKVFARLISGYQHILETISLLT